MVAENELAERAVSLEQLKEGSFYEKILLRSGLAELENKGEGSRGA